jgi:putative ABC transport system permease protein
MIAALNWIATFFRRLSFRAHRASLDEELRDEMQFHIDMLTRDNEARGMPPVAAREAARRQFGSATMLREASRSHWSLGWIDSIWQDVRYGLRSLLRTPGIILTTLASLTLGIGAVTTVAALLDATLLHPIALKDVDRIVTICQASPSESACAQLSPGNYIFLRDARTALQEVSLVQPWDVTVSGRSVATAAEGAVVTSNYFSMLGVTPLLGRLFTEADATASTSHVTVVILSYRFWLNQFNGDRGIVGRSVLLNGIPRVVIGVLRKNDAFPTTAALWGPLIVPTTALSNHNSFDGSMVLGRLRSGANVADASRDVTALHERLARESAATDQYWRFIVAPLKEFRIADVRPSLVLVTGAVIGLLLIACANVANLMLVRATGREREIAVRAALGAGRGQIARQMIIEGILLSLAAGVLGVLAGTFGVSLVKQAVPADLASYLPGWQAMGINRYVLLMMLGLCILIGVGFSAFPAFRAARTDLTGALKQGNRSSTGGRRIARVRFTLVASEIALAVILVTAAGLLVQSFARLTAANTGINPDRVLTLHLQLPATLDANQAANYQPTLIDRLQMLPGVRRAALIDRLPLSNSNNSGNFVPDSHPELTILKGPSAHDEVVTPGYFAVMGIPQISGRDFIDSDRDTTVSVTIVNRTLAERYWPGGNAIGHTIRTGSGRRDQYTIVGVVGDVRYAGADEAPGPEIYFPMRRGLWSTDVAIETVGSPIEMTNAVIKTAAAIDPSVAVARAITMRAMMARHYSFNSLLASVLGIFAIIAFVIAAAGVYGVVTYGVSQRTKEIGVRIALGAQYHTVVRMVLIDGARIAAIGIVCGIIGAWFAGNALAFLLYGVTPRDPMTLISVALILGVVALAASYFPARRAGRVEPVVALRYE